MRPLLTLVTVFICTNLFSQTMNWQKSLGGSAEDYGSFSQQTTDGGFIIAGSSASSDGNVNGHHGSESYNYDFWVVKVNKSGLTQWQKSLGGSGDDIANSVQQTSDGGYIVAGYTESIDGDVTGNHGYYDFWVVKLTSSGSIQWQKTLGGKKYDYARSIRQTSDGGYIVAGYTNSDNADVSGNHGNDDYWIVKLDGNGALKWQTSLGGDMDDLAYSAEQTKDGGYIVAGYAYSAAGQVKDNHGGADYWVVKLDASGGTEWRKAYGGSGNDFAYSMVQTAEGGYIINGYSASEDGDVSHIAGMDDYWIVKINNTGVIEWQRSYGAGYNEIASGIQQITDGGFILTGSSSSNSGRVKGNHGDYDYWMIRLNPLKIFINANTGTNICVGTKVTCTAKLTDGSTPESYIWKKNGKMVSNGQIYTDSTLNDGDSLVCLYKVSGNKYYSNRLVFTVNEKAAPVVTVTSIPGLNICAGTPVTFTATSKMEGSNPKYSWFKNDVFTGVKGDVYTDNALNDKDSVWCELITDATCVTTNTAISRKLKFNVSTRIPHKPSDIIGPTLVTPLQKAVAYKVTAVEGFNYSWDVPKGCRIVSGNGTASIKVDWGDEGGKIKVSATNSCGTSEKQSKLVVSILTSASRSASFAQEDSRNIPVFTAQPNPVKDIVTVQFASTAADKYSLQVRDVSGKLILEKAGVSTTGLNQVKLNLGGYSSGVYFITLLTEQDKKVIKIIKE